jgi:tetratricopeptide (TPR) repeat protein
MIHSGRAPPKPSQEKSVRSALVQRWIDLSVAVTREETAAIPLIDESLDLPDLDEELHQVWRDGDSELHADFVEALVENPTNLGVRFAALNAYHHLMEHKRGSEEEDILGRLAKRRVAFRKKLAFFVGFQPVESSADLRTIRWEIVNSCAAEDYDRAFRLCDRLQPLLPSWHVSFARGRLHFLAVHLPLWDDPPSLSSWDLPIGPPLKHSLSIFSRMMGPFLTLRRCFTSPELTTGISDDARAHLRRAIAELETASDGNSDIPLECRLMLARSYAAVGQNHEAARCFRRVLAHRDALPRYFKEPLEFLQLPIGDYLPELLSALFHRLITAHQRAEEIEEAIKAAQEWIDEFPTAEAYPIMARLYEEKGDVDVAWRWFRKGEERFPELGNDWKTSLILKLGETASPASRDQAINTYIARHLDEIQMISFALERHWSAFRYLDQESKERWSAGIYLLNNMPWAGAAGSAVHEFSWVIERALRESIFVPFKEQCQRNPELLGDISQPTEEAKVFCQFLSGKVPLAFGQMLKIAEISVDSCQTPFGPFSQWLKTKRPSYFQRIGQLRERMMVDLRNREDHANLTLITEANADKMLESSKEVISLIHEDPA